MKRIDRIPLWAITLTLLCFVNMGWMLWRAFARPGTVEQFKLQTLNTEIADPWPYMNRNASSIGLINLKNRHPVWAKWNLDVTAGNLDLQSYYFQGEKVFDVYWTNGRPPVFNVYFRDANGGLTWWQNRFGADGFNERIFYDANGTIIRNEVWFQNTWYPVEKRNKRRGIIINENWHQLEVDTNGAWTIHTNK